VVPILFDPVWSGYSPDTVGAHGLHKRIEGEKVLWLQAFLFITVAYWSVWFWEQTTHLF